MAIAATMQAINLNQDGTVDLFWVSGDQRTFASVAEVADYVTDLDMPVLVEKMMLRWWLLRDPEAQSPGIVVGKTLTFDMLQPLMINVE